MNHLGTLSDFYQAILLTSDQTLTTQTMWSNPTPRIINVAQNSSYLTVYPQNSPALTFDAISPLTISTATITLENLVTASMFRPPVCADYEVSRTWSFTEGTSSTLPLALSTLPSICSSLSSSTPVSSTSATLSGGNPLPSWM
jgi:hypothetical protein